MSADLVRYEPAVDVDLAPPLADPIRTAQEARQRAEFAQALLQAQLANDEWMAVQWTNMHEDWLRFVTSSRSGSEHTLRNYRLATRQWREFVATLRHQEGPDAGFPVKVWQVDANHVRQWQAQLGDSGASQATIGLKLSAVSSFYSFVINEKRMAFGVEMCLFVDALGNARANPFRFGNIQRPKVSNESGRARPLQPQELGALFTYLQGRQHTLAGARNFALILAYLETGFRNAEVVRMQWKHIRPSKSQKERIIYAWKGKGGKTEDEPIPESVWHAITHYLYLDGRWIPNAPLHEQPLQPDDFIFRAVSHRGTAYLANVTEFDEEGAISGKSALRILRTALRHAGIADADTVRVHDLRHTWALRMVADGANDSEVQRRAHHSSLETTARYIGSLKQKSRDRKDVRSGRLAVQLRAFADGDAPASWEEVIEG
jgi:integrase